MAKTSDEKKVGFWQRLFGKSPKKSTEDAPVEPEVDAKASALSEPSHPPPD